MMYVHPQILYMFLNGQIPVQSCYEAKGVAGNIIPAIATTNAIIAGLQVPESAIMPVTPKNIAVWGRSTGGI